MNWKEVKWYLLNIWMDKAILLPKLILYSTITVFKSFIVSNIHKLDRLKLQCIVCQLIEPGIGKVTSTSNGRKRIRNAALRMSWWNDIQNNDYFVYHMTYEWYKKYTLNKTLNTIDEYSNTKG